MFKEQKHEYQIVYNANAHDVQYITMLGLQLVDLNLSFVHIINR